MRAAWTRLHEGDDLYGNKRILLRTPPVAIAGRWASVDSIPSRNGLIIVTNRMMMDG